MTRLILGLFLLFQAQASFSDVKLNDEIAYRDRNIPIRKHIEGFQYKSFFFDSAHQEVFFIRKGDREILHSLQYHKDEVLELSKGEPLSAVDFSKRNFWGLKVNPVSKQIYVLSDESNEEIMNLYGLSRLDGKLKKLTNVGYIYGWSVSPRGKWIAYSARSGAQEFTPGYVGLLNAATGENKFIFTDAKELRMTWTNVLWNPREDRVILSAVCDEDRTRQTVLSVPIDGGPATRLLDCGTKRETTVLNHWVDSETIAIISSETGNPGDGRSFEESRQTICLC